MDYRVNRAGEQGNTGRSNRRRNRYYGKVILLCVMIGFCILALIEIIYGQEKLRLERERIALEEKNARTLQVLENEPEEVHGTDTAQADTAAENVPTDTAGMVDLTAVDTGNANEAAAPEEAAGTNGEAAQPDAAEDGDAATVQEDEEKYDMQIVFMGDSILDSTREYDGVAYLISKSCNAKVYNLSMGGTTAALGEGETGDYTKWDSRCLLGVVNAIIGNIDPGIFDDYKTGQLLKECDFSKTDYFVIEYGINDFLSQIPTSRYLADGETRKEDAEHTYGGALEQAVRKLHAHFPDAKIVLVAPHYCQFFSGSTFIGDAYSLDFGYGALIDYMRACGYVYDQHREENVLLYNAFEDSGINAYTADDYLEDGVHLSSQGRQIYAEGLSRKIMKDFYPQE
ncbi:MAG: SGNH/GDSL hydrolase family protein [Lachnospiraceae bacterium]|nr:SGNH/GDSL hydrolase family protein [Lachnospiraceae bacterium]